MTEPLVRHVSDTAHWVAAFRAQESQRPDALFRDPLAARLSGTRGQAIATHSRKPMGNGWPIVARTKVIDDLVLWAVAQGYDGVLNLAAGLDTRPYRMDLPRDFRWVEADLGPLMDEKEAQLAGEVPRCSLRRERVDLADGVARARFLDEALEGMGKAFVLTEGLLPYLDDAAVRALSRDFRCRPAVGSWVFDLASPAVTRMVRAMMKGHLERAPMRFAPPEGVAFFEVLGWKVVDVWSLFHEAARLRRVPWWMRLLAQRFAPSDPRALGEHARWSGVVHLAPNDRRSEGPGASSS